MPTLYHAQPKRVMSVQQALEWAFRTECAQLKLPEPPDPEREHGYGFGLEYVLMQRAGCCARSRWWRDAEGTTLDIGAIKRMKDAYCHLAQICYIAAK